MTITARTAPTGIPMINGFKTTIAFAANAAVKFWEETVAPPGFDGGEKVEMTSMLNISDRTYAAQVLKTLTDTNITAFWVPALYTDIVALINTNGWITVHLPDLSNIRFVGYLQSAIPQAHTNNSPPKIDIKINVTNRLNNGIETVPVWTATV